MIYGTDDHAVRTYEFLKNDTKNRYVFKGFISEKKNERRYVQGVPILPLNKIDDKFLSKEAIEYLLFTPSIKNPIDLLEKTGKFIRAGVKIKTVPPPDQWVDSILNPEDIKEFDLEALLERPRIQPDDMQIEREIQGKVVWVTGGAGSIGSELARQIIYYSPEKLILIDQAETPLYEMELELREKHNRRGGPF